MRRFIQGLILVNIAIVAITTFAEYTHDSAQAPAGSPFATALLDLVAISIAYVVVSLLVFARFDEEPLWLLVPVAFLIPLSLAAIYQALNVGGPVAPGVGRLLLVAGYLAGYFVLRPASPSAQGHPGRVIETA